MGHVATFSRLQHQVADPIAALRFVLAQHPGDIAALAEQIPQHHRILQRRAAALADIRRGAVPGIAQQRHLAANQSLKRFNIMDFNAVGGLRIEGGDQLLHLRRPAAKVAAEIRP